MMVIENFFQEFPGLKSLINKGFTSFKIVLRSSSLSWLPSRIFLALRLELEPFAAPYPKSSGYMVSAKLEGLSSIRPQLLTSSKLTPLPCLFYDLFLVVQYAFLYPQLFAPQTFSR